jgi:aspartate racemase
LATPDTTEKPGRSEYQDNQPDISDKSYRAKRRTPSRQAYQRVIDRLQHAGAEGVILGCTEIELLIRPQDSPIPVFPTTRLHVEAAIEQALVPGGR